MCDLKNCVSICIPSFNHGAFISDAINSVLKQTHQDFELIIVDNRSSDNTVDIVNEYVKIDSRVKFHINNHNIGMVGNWNRCLELSNCKFVKILCSDDILEPTCIERSVNNINISQNVGLVACARSIVSRNLSPIDVWTYPVSEKEISGKDVVRHCLTRGNLIGEPTAVLFRKEFSLRGFNPAYGQLADIEMWLNILTRSNFYYDSSVQCKFRQHEEQCTKLNMKECKFIEERFLLVSDYKKSLDTFECNIALFMASLEAWHHVRRGYDKEKIVEIIDKYFGYKKFLVFYPFRSVLRKINKNLKITVTP